ncbi:MAG TPA: NAD-dependent epimerase/dehydratase family protein [Planctomycetes bacterium]|nr:NAD-dependent epimerase/dehydratase family protein [Planctomycetota bacterium]
MKVLVTGGGGFLGLAIVRELLERGHVPTSVSRSPHAELEDLGVPSERFDLTRFEGLDAIVRGHDAVIHTAAKAGVWGPHAEFFAANVTATKNLLESSLRCGVTRFVHTSSPSVCFDGKPHRMAKNDVPFARRPLSSYAETKAIAEKLVLRANGSHTLATTALRPHLIIGPRDPHLVPRLLDRARRGRLVRVGAGTNEVSLTDVINAAAAHVDALEALEAADAPHAGRGYFLAQSEAVRLWDWIDEVLVGVGLEPVRRRVPFPLAYGLGALLELVAAPFPRLGEPPMTRFVARQLATDHSYSIEPAERDFGYRERISLREATQRVIDAFR